MNVSVILRWVGGVESALKATSIINGLDFVYGTSDDFIDYQTGFNTVLQIAAKKAEKAYGAAVLPEDSPRSWAEAMSRSDRDEWMKAAEAEIEALVKNGSWELVKLAKGAKAIGSRCVLLIKRKSDGSIDRYKGRLAAKGHAQAPGIDFDQVAHPPPH